MAKGSADIYKRGDHFIFKKNLLLCGFLYWGYAKSPYTHIINLLWWLLLSKFSFLYLLTCRH